MQEYEKTVEALKSYLRVGLSYDILARPFMIGGRRSFLLTALRRMKFSKSCSNM